MGYNLLVVDDSAITRKVIKRAISMTGLDLGDVYAAQDGAEALEVLSANWIDIVFSDLNMPRMSGTELIEKMAEDHLLDSIPVIVITSDRNQPRLSELKTGGVRAHLNKPFRPEELREVMTRVLAKGREAEVDREKLQSALVAAARRVLEDAAFVFTEEADAPADASAWPATLSQASLTFVGPVSGRFMLAASSRLGETLAAEMLGAEPDSPGAAEQADDALRELLNMITGATLAQVFAQEPWEMGVTASRRVAPAEHLDSLSGADVSVHLDTEASDPVELAVFLDGERDQ
jgi:two-component system chemotaxis response regulator CheY